MASVFRSLTKAEKNYVALELEYLAVVFACSKFDQYIYGKKGSSGNGPYAPGSYHQEIHTSSS